MCIVTELVSIGCQARSNYLAEDSKRLLLTDPDVILDRLTRLENQVVQLQNDNRKLTQENQQQTLTIKAMETSLADVHKQQSTPKYGSTYTIWGRTSCPVNNDTEEVYSGYAAGGLFSEKGSSPDILCATQNPVFGKTSGSVYGHLYGAEFDDNFFASHGNGEDIPCAVCQRHSTISSLMIPGTTTCYPGWHKDYHGYLGTAQAGQGISGSEYICIDINPEFLVAGEVNTNAGRLIGAVFAKCGILKCPPYHDNYPVTCVVCSK
ncbi:unnamed protein product [Mytilus edulis]|uniref:Short-chain collagen C4 n=1 Tax=Mytilus edulis TaxID=6550 RepID=A0A8S3UWT9_MYTED|nr:unnamed protein product [Mytilus edulis]